MDSEAIYVVFKVLHEIDWAYEENAEAPRHLGLMHDGRVICMCCGQIYDEDEVLICSKETNDLPGEFIDVAELVGFEDWEW